jgi:hypothetical protein
MRRMSAKPAPLSYTEIEVRSYLPSGWGIVPGERGRWSAADGSWKLPVYDGADNVWTIEVRGADAADRMAALQASIQKIQRKGLGRKSIISG